MFSHSDVAVVICTMNSADSILQCLQSVSKCLPGQIVVVDGRSTDETLSIVQRFTDEIFFDDGTGLGAARALGISHTHAPLVLNLGSDNLIDPAALSLMIYDLSAKSVLGVSARTRILGDSYIAKSLNLYRSVRFQSGHCSVIGTPSLFPGHELRENGFDPKRRFSDDAELCERWSKGHPGMFYISDVLVDEIGKTTFREVITRWTMYGVSDYEIFWSGLKSGWSNRRKLQSLSYPLKHEFLHPLRTVPFTKKIYLLPFLILITSIRYGSWLRHATRKRKDRIGNAINA